MLSMWGGDDGDIIGAVGAPKCHSKLRKLSGLGMQISICSHR